MYPKTYLVLFKDEWERLKQQAGPQEKPVNHENQYLKALTEKSQKWIKSWPDTVLGHIAQVEKKKKKQHAKDVAMIKTYARKEEKDSTDEVIKKARQLIFEDSCYGKQLISALAESKTLEERDIQVLFQRDLKQKAAAEMKQSNRNVHCSFDLDKRQAENHRARQVAALETAELNKQICKSNRDKIAIEYAKEKENRQEETRMMEQLLITETLEKGEHTNAEKQTITEFEAAMKQLKDQKAKREELSEIAAERNRKHQEVMKCKIQEVYKEIYKGRQDTALSNKNYKLIEKIKQEEKKRYDEFVEKGIKDYEQRISKMEQEDAKKQELKKSSPKQSKQKPAKTLKDCNATRMLSDRQSIITKSRKSPLRRSERGIKPDADSNHQFLIPCKSLVQDLKKRKEEPSPWSGTKAAHADFAVQADEILRQCTYKTKARKVVDDYMKLNCLDTLPVTNY